MNPTKEQDEDRRNGLVYIILSIRSHQFSRLVSGVLVCCRLPCCWSSARLCVPGGLFPGAFNGRGRRRTRRIKTVIHVRLPAHYNLNWNCRNVCRI